MEDFLCKFRINDELSMPLQNSEVHFQFLSEVTKWLDEWKSLPNKQGISLPKLTSFSIYVSSLNIYSNIVPKIVALLMFGVPFSKTTQSKIISGYTG